ncbi:MAG: FAD-dependent oxidoreductase [Candidatus Dadabacteria bacterium]|nr:FAD-dependent oxidoreductase [Candidatus Dadabacteria bacterium]NIS09043.1 FAD-dependent oxidoreductase [Candidatus Dadabacteria bacterium]NIX15637.1 FAD-dependent oxidoreductase [Candidatus Dadabacteria bacterium]NIY22379.1 FAD-dependent oxidoreductase [Candidatus Dadabacteria bacterium]
MPKPVIITVDDEQQVSNAIERDLRKHYRKDYQIVKNSSGPQALETVHQLKKRNTPIALFLADQRMPEMGGTEFLSKAKEFYPEARKVLLTAYADTDAAISAINNVGLDYYLMKPWDPPEQNFYPVLDDLLGDWQATAQLPYDGIRVAGTLWSCRCHNVKDFLARSQIPYQWLDIEQNDEARELVESVNSKEHQLPVVFFPDGSVLINPDITELAEKAGLKTKATQPFYDLIIIGAGPAGLAGAVYGSSEGLKTLLIDKETTGGQAGTSSRIENYLGFPKGLSGADLARRATAQATRLGAEILTAQEVTKISVREPYKHVKLKDGTELSCKAIIIATGVSLRQLDLHGIEHLTGAGVYYGAALSEAEHYKDQHVFVVGGANSAGQGAMFFSRYASKVTMLVRSSLSKSMSHYLIDQINSTSNIEVLSKTEVIEVHGKDRLEAITIKNSESDKTDTVQTPAMFLFIGAAPHTQMVKDVIELSEAGFILTGPDLIQNVKRPKNWRLKRDPYLMETSIPGIFAAGDVRHGAVRRVASAVGQGSITVNFVHEYLKTV